MRGRKMSRNEELNGRERISRAIIQMLDKYPFYAELLMRSKIKELPEECKMRSMAVDMTGNILYDEGFVQSLDESGLEFVLLHETLHKAHMHLFRLNDRNVETWNIAADIVVNDELMNELHLHPPKEVKGIIPTSDRDIVIPTPIGEIRVEDIDEKSVEDVFIEVEKQMPPKQNRKGSGNGSGDDKSGQGIGEGFDEHRYEFDGEQEKDGTTLAEAEEKLKDEIIEAAFRAKKKGTLPAKFERLVDELLKEKIDWKSVVYRHVVSEIPYDYTLTRPNRRFISQGLYLPGVLKENLHVIAMVDTSGSVSQKELKDFLSELRGILHSHENVKIDVLIHDTKIHKVHTLQKNDDFKSVKAIGGGGTSHIDCFEWVEKNGGNARLVIGFTDGHSQFPEKAPRQEVLWVLSGRYVNKDIPFGTVVQIE